MTWSLIKEETQGSDAGTLTANFTNVNFSDVACFVISFQGTDGIASQGSQLKIGTSSGVLTSDYDLQSIYIGDTSGGLPASPSYYGFVNQSYWMINNSWADNSSFPMIYVWSNPVSDKPQCSMTCGNETTWIGMSGWIDQTLTSLGEVMIDTGVNDILQNSRLQVYKVSN